MDDSKETVSSRSSKTDAWMNSEWRAACTGPVCTGSSQMGSQHWEEKRDMCSHPLTKKPFAIDTRWQRKNQCLYKNAIECINDSRADPCPGELSQHTMCSMCFSRTLLCFNTFCLFISAYLCWFSIGGGGVSWFLHLFVFLRGRKSTLIWVCRE